MCVEECACTSECMYVCVCRGVCMYICVCRGGLHIRVRASNPGGQRCWSLQELVSQTVVPGTELGPSNSGSLALSHGAVSVKVIITHSWIAVLTLLFPPTFLEAFLLFEALMFSVILLFPLVNTLFCFPLPFY